MLAQAEKPIRISPEEVLFENVVPNKPYLQQVTVKNTLSAPVEFVLKTSNSERLNVTPKTIKLAAFETSFFDLELKLPRPFPRRQGKQPAQKETLFLRSDFFDQKLNVLIVPPDAPTSASMRASSSTPKRVASADPGDRGFASSAASRDISPRRSPKNK